MDDSILQLKNVTKVFPGVRALDDVSFDIRKNTVHCLVGENGAGKSTLIKILTGAYERTSGTVLLRGEKYSAANTRDARKKGIGTLFQELNVVDQLTVEENLTLGLEDVKLGFLQKTDRFKRMLEVLRHIAPGIDPCQKVAKLSVAKKQLVEIAKAVASDAEVIIMDEPTAAISEGEIKRLFAIIKGLRERNVTVIYISHRLDEIFELGDYVTVLRDGRHIATKPIAEVEGRAELVRLMIGKTVVEGYTPKEQPCLEPILEVRGLCNNKLHNLSFTVMKGEIIGFYGLIGAGKTEIARALFGADEYEGEVILHGLPLQRTPDGAIAAGVALVPEERRQQGVFTALTVKANIPVMNMNKVSRWYFVDAGEERRVAREYVGKLHIATNSIDKDAGKLSGGNQQKVVFSKCLFADSSLLLLDEPTRGVDVGAKGEIYSIIRSLSAEGKSILMFSSELSEILNNCDRIFLLYDGVLKAELQNGPDISMEQIINIVTGGDAQ